MIGAIRWSQLVGQRVLARDTGQLLGSLRRLLLDGEATAIVAAQLDGGGGGSSLIDWRALVDIGPDAVVVDAADAAREPRDEREQMLLAGRLDLDGKLVLTEMGDSLGRLEDIELEFETGRLLRLHVPGEVLEVERIAGFGPDVLILPERTPEPTAEPRPAG